VYAIVLGGEVVGVVELVGVDGLEVEVGLRGVELEELLVGVDVVGNLIITGVGFLGGGNSVIYSTSSLSSAFGFLFVGSCETFVLLKKE
jgi:hypothetical protein